jgi:hypothetical protein
MDSVRVPPKLDPRFILLPVIAISLIFLGYLLIIPQPEKEQTTVSTTTPTPSKEEDEVKGGIAGTIEGPVVVSIMPLNESNASSSVSNPSNSSK